MKEGWSRSPSRRYAFMLQRKLRYESRKGIVYNFFIITLLAIALAVRAITLAYSIFVIISQIMHPNR